MKLKKATRRTDAAWPRLISSFDRDRERLALLGDERRDELQGLGLAEIDAVVHVGRLGRI